MNQDIVEVTLENARQVLIDESRRRLVVVDFWADWCAPCKALMPILEKLATEYKGQFLLAKVNADREPDIAGQFGVRSLPTVILMRDGQPVDAFQGAQPETQVRKILEKHLPPAWEAILDAAIAKMQAGDFEGALPQLRTAYDESGRIDYIGLALAQDLIQLNRCDEAETVLKGISAAGKGPDYDNVLALLQARREAAKSPEIEALERRLHDQPDNGDLVLELAAQYRAERHFEAALELLLGLLKRDRDFGEGAAKKAFLDTLAALGKGDPMAVRFQRQFFNLLY
ncbi:MAG: thioredoxin [Porticoccaceae bacterium]